MDVTKGVKLFESPSDLTAEMICFSSSFKNFICKGMSSIQAQ
jgi:hypothetical protein